MEMAMLLRMEGGQCMAGTRVAMASRRAPQELVQGLLGDLQGGTALGHMDVLHMVRAKHSSSKVAEVLASRLFHLSWLSQALCKSHEGYRRKTITLFLYNIGCKELKRELQSTVHNAIIYILWWSDALPHDTDWEQN